MADPDISAALKRLRAKVAGEAEALGLRLEVFGIVVGSEGEDDVAQAMFSAGEKRDEDQDAIDAAFEKMVQDQRIAEIEAKAAEARDSLKKISDRLKNNDGGFL